MRMKIMVCPLNGPRNISEFVCFGEIKDMPDADAASDRDWTSYLFLEPNVAGVVDEWWLHAPSNFWFIARRNTVTDEIVETMTLDRYRASRGPAEGSGSVGGASAGGDADAGGMGRSSE
jgi:sarcosine oxidase subunit delta